MKTVLSSTLNFGGRVLQEILEKCLPEEIENLLRSAQIIPITSAKPSQPLLKDPTSKIQRLHGTVFIEQQ